MHAKAHVVSLGLQRRSSPWRLRLPCLRLSLLRPTGPLHPNQISSVTDFIVKGLFPCVFYSARPLLGSQLHGYSPWHWLETSAVNQGGWGSFQLFRQSDRSSQWGRATGGVYRDGPRLMYYRMRFTRRRWNKMRGIENNSFGWGDRDVWGVTGPQFEKHEMGESERVVTIWRGGERSWSGNEDPAMSGK